MNWQTVKFPRKDSTLCPKKQLARADLHKNVAIRVDRRCQGSVPLPAAPTAPILFTVPTLSRPTRYINYINFA